MLSMLQNLLKFLGDAALVLEPKNFNFNFVIFFTYNFGMKQDHQVAK